MPKNKKKPLEVSKEFVEQVLAIIANETEEGRKKIVAIARRAEEKYEQPVKSWITGWVYQYTRTRGEKVEQSINVMENFPDAYTRLQEFKLMISEGKWEVGSYNYYLFLELIDAVPDYQTLPDVLIQPFVIELKEQVMMQINDFMAHYKTVLAEIKAREIEREAARESTRLLAETVAVLNNLDAAKDYQSNNQDKITFSLNYENEQWHLAWVDTTGEVYPLIAGDELVKKLATLEDKDIEKLSQVRLRGIKRECLKAREQYIAKVQVHINPKDTNAEQANVYLSELIEKGTTSAFVLQHKEKVASLCWINTRGVSQEISLANSPKLSSWLATHQGPFNEADTLQLKAYLLQVNITQSKIASAKIDKMNAMFAKVLQKKDEVTKEETHKNKAPQPKINLKQFAFLEQHMKDRIENVVSKKSSTEVVSKAAPKLEQGVDTTSPKLTTEEAVSELPAKLEASRYTALSQLSTFWQQRKRVVEGTVDNEIKNSSHP